MTDRSIEELDFYEEQSNVRSELLNLLDLQKPFQVDFPNGDMLTYFDEEDKINEFYQQYSIHKDRSRTPEQSINPRSFFQPEKVVRSNSLPSYNNTYDEYCNYVGSEFCNSPVNYYQNENRPYYSNIENNSYQEVKETPIIETKPDPEPTSNIIDRTDEIKREFSRKSDGYEYVEKFDSPAKPTLSYAQIITQAIRQSKHKKLTLSEIYKWIEDNYEYYKHANPVWKNSIRHNLSLSKCFRKVSRPPGSKGKGGFWAIDESFVAAEEHKRSRRYIRDGEESCTGPVYKHRDAFFNSIEVSQYKDGNSLNYENQNMINSFVYKRKL